MNNPDPYETKYMSGAGSIARARKRMPLHYHLLFGVPCLLVLFAAVASGAWPVLALLPFVALLWVLFMHIRIHVTQEHVHIQLGVFGPKIPREAIVSARVETYDAKKYKSKVVHAASDGSIAYYVAGGSERGVRIEYRDAANELQSVFASCEEADAIVEAIESVRRTAVAARVEEETHEPAPAEEHVAEPSKTRSKSPTREQ